MAERRWYVRCIDCLAVGAVDLPDSNVRGFPAEPERGVCPCGGQIETMGRVSKARLVKDAIKSPCDHSCTMARGPLCECHCRGANHGSKALVLVTRDVGAVPRYELQASHERAAEYRGAVRDAEGRQATAWAAVLPLVQRQGNGVYLDRADFDRINNARRAVYSIVKAKRARTHKGRLTILAGILPAPVEVPCCERWLGLHSATCKAAPAPPCIVCGAPEDGHDEGCSIGEGVKRG